MQEGKLIMILKILDILGCPKCGDASRYWKLQGEVTDTRITNGSVFCKNEHEWNVTEEILRFDNEKSTEEMQFSDHPRTGLPDRKKVMESERLSFLDAFEEAVQSLPFDQHEIIKIAGDPVLFMKYMPSVEKQLLVIYHDEGVLRQLQEIAARKQMYDKMSFVRAKDVNYIGQILSIDVFQEGQGTVQLKLGEFGEEYIWKGERSNLYLSGS